LAAVVAVAVMFVLAAGCGGGAKQKDATSNDGTQSDVGTGSQETLAIVARGSSLSVTAIGSSSATGAPGDPAAGLSVRSAASATVAADKATIVVVPPIGGFGPGGPQPISPQYRKDILAGLAALGIKSGDISVDSNQQYGPFGTTISVVAALGQVQALGPQVVEAVEKVTGRSQSSGVQFELMDCASALSSTRKEAFKGLETRARDLAAIGSLKLGPLVAVSEGASPSIYSPYPVEPCGPSTQVLKAPSNLQPFDAKPEVRVTLEVRGTYSLGDLAGAGLSATGSGFATAKPDRAYVVVLAQTPQSGSGPAPLSGRDRDRAMQKLTGLGFNTKDITITSQSPYGGNIVIQVAVPLDSVAKAGKSIVDGVEEILGRSQSSGVRYGHSNCQAVLATAQGEATTAARNRAAALATSGGVKLGALTGISANAVTLPYNTIADPCSDDASILYASSPMGGVIKPFDAEPAFKVETAVVLTFAIVP
jgi:uncharacterized protein YggE